MRKFIAATLFTSFSVVLFTQAAESMAQAEMLKAELSKAGPTAFTSPDHKPGTIRHIVLFRYKDGTTQAERDEVRRRFMALASDSKRDGATYIAAIETGMQNSGEGVDGGFEEAFVVTFRSEGDRNYYVGTPIVNDPAFLDPEHQKFKDFVGPFLAEGGVLVFDFDAVDSAH